MLSRFQLELERAWGNYKECLKMYENKITPKQYGEMLATKKRHKKKAR